MRKTYPHFEQVPVAVAEKILEQQGSPAKGDVRHKLVLKKRRRTANARQAVTKRVRFLLP
jgi:hypothetical protein